MRAVDVKTHKTKLGDAGIIVEHVPTGIMIGNASMPTYEENRKVAMRKLRDTVASYTGFKERGEHYV